MFKRENEYMLNVQREPRVNAGGSAGLVSCKGHQQCYEPCPSEEVPNAHSPRVTPLAAAVSGLKSRTDSKIQMKCYV